MHTADLLDYALAVARQMGYRVRLEWLGGSGGGGCEFAGKQWIFLDLALSTDEQLELVLEVLEADPRIGGQRLARPLARLLHRRRAA